MTDAGWRPVARAALLYSALTLVLAYPLSIRPASTVLSDGPDPNLFMWTLAWDAHAIINQPLAIFDANIYYPERHTLAYSENLLGSTVIAAPVIWTTGNLVLAMNLVALSSAVLCGVGVYLLGRKVGLGEAGALIAGLIFAFSPPRFLRLDQLHLATIQWIGFALAYLWAYFDHGRRRDVRLFAAFLTLQALTSGHGFALAFLASVVVVLVRLAMGAPLALARRVRDVGVTGFLLLTPIVLMALPYRAVQSEIGLRRTLENWTVPAESFFASPSHVDQWILGAAGVADRVNGAAMAYLFPGWLVLLLALPAVFIARGARRPVDAFLLVSVVSLFMAVGPPWSLWPHVYWLPGLNFIRVPSRFMLLAVLGLAVVAGFGFERLTARFAARRTLLAVVAGALLLAEFATMPFEVIRQSIEIPSIDRWVATAPNVRAIAEVPVIDPAREGPAERRHTAYMLHSTAHWWKTVEGYSGTRPPRHAKLYEMLTRFPDEASLSALADLDVTHVVVHTEWYDPAVRPEIEARLAQSSWLQRARCDRSGCVYVLRRP
jgi:hypothetical protein